MGKHKFYFHLGDLEFSLYAPMFLIGWFLERLVHVEFLVRDIYGMIPGWVKLGTLLVVWACMCVWIGKQL